MLSNRRLTSWADAMELREGRWEIMVKMMSSGREWMVTAVFLRFGTAFRGIVPGVLGVDGEETGFRLGILGVEIAINGGGVFERDSTDVAVD